MKKKKKKKRKTNPSPPTKKKLVRLVSGVFKTTPGVTFNYKQVAKILDIKDPNIRKEIIVVLKKLVDDGYLNEHKKGSYSLDSDKTVYTGVIKNTNKKGLYIAHSSCSEVFIDKAFSNFAITGDKVEYIIFAKKKSGFRGEIVRVFERQKASFTGVLDPVSLCFLIPDDKSLYFDIFIPPKNVSPAYINKKLLVNIESWSVGQKSPVGKIKKVLGEKDSVNSEMRSIIYNYGFSSVFSEEVLSKANKISDFISKKNSISRLDYRQVVTFTIDPEDAKDFDDALSVKKLGPDSWEVGVHIADVSHFVAPNSVLDEEAYKRGTSVYLCDRVVPMLPENISNNVCSLKPNIDRFAFSIIFEINSTGRVLDFKICETIIHSNHRFTYKEAQETIDTKSGPFFEELIVLNRIYKKLRKKRFNTGSINFESSEIKFVLNNRKEPIKTFKKPVLDSNHLIEEFMLLANKTIAEFISLKNLEFIYRIHDSPDMEKITALSKIIKPLTLKNTPSLSLGLNNLLSDVNGKKEQKLIETLVLRSMAKAVYSTNNIGHFGLGFNFYSHFTSPIRRYPDLITHRLLKLYLKSVSFSEKFKLDDVCSHCSKMEKNAISAERASSKFMQAKFLSKKIGEVFSGIISGVTEWGFYVELIENGCEGLVRAATLKDDHYIYNEKQHSLIGINTKRIFLLGSVVKIKVASVSLEKHQINFTII